MRTKAVTNELKAWEKQTSRRCCTIFRVFRNLLCSCTVRNERLVLARDVITLTHDWCLMTSGASSESQLKDAPSLVRLARSSSALEMTQTSEASTLMRLISQGSCVGDFTKPVPVQRHCCSSDGVSLTIDEVSSSVVTDAVSTSSIDDASSGDATFDGLVRRRRSFFLPVVASGQFHDQADDPRKEYCYLLIHTTCKWSLKLQNRHVGSQHGWRAREQPPAGHRAWGCLIVSK